MPDLVFMKGMLFSDHKEFKRVVQSYWIKHGYPLLIVKNESRKVSYKCENCEWYIYASWDREENFLLVKSYCGKYSCSRAFHSKMAITIVITLNKIRNYLLSQIDCHYNLSQWLNYNSPIQNTSSFLGLFLLLKWPPQ